MALFVLKMAYKWTGGEKIESQTGRQVSSSGRWSSHSISLLQPDCPQRIMHIQSSSEQTRPMTSWRGEMGEKNRQNKREREMVILWPLSGCLPVISSHTDVITVTFFWTLTMCPLKRSRPSVGLSYVLTRIYIANLMCAIALHCPYALCVNNDGL